jgi:hypothetical protein
MTTTLNASTAGAGGFIATSDNSGSLALQTAGTTAITVDTSQNVGIGTTTPLYTAANRQTTTINGGAGGAMLSFGISGTGKGSIFQNNSDILNISGYPNAVTFSSGATDVERMRIDSSGNLLVGATSGGGKLSITGTGASGWVQNNVNSGTGTVASIVFTNDNGVVGSIQTSASLTVYNTTSDYRLKTVVGAVTGQGERIDALQPIVYTWKVDGLQTRGFLAHQFQEVYGGSVTGTKDEIDADGKPVYQSMQASTSEVIADLVAEIQLLRKRLATIETKSDTQAETINALTARIVALETA